MDFRTDLTLERARIRKDDLPGLTVEKREKNGCRTEMITVTDEDTAEKLGKGKGKYITVTMDDLKIQPTVGDERCRELTDCIRSLLPGKFKNVLFAGVGNPDITSDSLGPLIASNVIATRYMKNELPDVFGKELCSVSSISTGVLGKTGVESAEYIKSLCEAVKPDCVITADALAAGSVSRLGCTVQLSDTGIAPGSGVGNKRERIDESFLGVPVIAIGVPTVVDALSLASELSGINAEDMKNGCDSLMVAPKDIDKLVKNAAFLIGMSINCALHPSLSPDELFSLM